MRAKENRKKIQNAIVHLYNGNPKEIAERELRSIARTIYGLLGESGLNDCQQGQDAETAASSQD